MLGHACGHRCVLCFLGAQLPPTLVWTSAFLCSLVPLLPSWAKYIPGPRLFNPLNQLHLGVCICARLCTCVLKKHTPPLVVIWERLTGETLGGGVWYTLFWYGIPG